MPTVTIVSPEDRPIYEASFPQALSGRQAVLEQIVLHSSLDMVDEKMWDTRDMYLKVVDRYNDQLISAFVTPSNYRFLLLHDSRHEDGVKPFFNDLHELFVKATLNPLYVDNEPITSTAFHDKVLLLARKYL
ncbi:Trafficking protein particle complex subunit 2 [Gracilariopsis chorda]|uniref:Trafficking protein particle complex subunit 2 n=1 Tax=Gracilariopsis chorda TaxID=448386 RepID=A0A2V3IZJ6_9FLOR|nr:Trafficking protein particle complex subunit 2 [Gracilariopsis chorda]|eukprot:PXF47582.1 Trafficking protein particle complex subunit 2 [Gracilariopsis chorda]